SGRQQISCNGVLNVICPSRISPIAQKLLTFLPAPNLAAGLGQNNFVVNTVREKTIHSFDVKLNYQLNEKNSIGGRLSFQRPQIFDPGTFGIYGGPTNSGFAGSGTQDTYSTAGNWTHTFNPRLILDVRVGVSYYHNVAISQAAGLKTSDEVGIKNANTDDFSSGLTQIRVAGFGNVGTATDPLLGFSASLPWDRGETTTNITGVVTKLFGNHTLKVGGEWRRNRDFLLQIQDNGGVRGRFIFGGAQTGLAQGGGVAADGAANSGLANALASFLLDAPNSVGRDIKIIDQPGTRHWAVFSFIQDKWQVTQKLTLDLGLRHEYYRPFTGIVEKGGLSNYDPSNNTARVAGHGDVGQDLGVTSTWKNFAPRLGASYRFNDKTVVRAGFGTTIIPFPNNSYAFNFPVKQNNQFNPSHTFLAAGSRAAGFPAPIIFDIPASGVIDASLPVLRNTGLFSVPLDLREGKIHSWNFAFQRELWWGFTAEAAYVGNVGKGVITPIDINASTDPNAARAENNNGSVVDNAGRPFFKKFGRSASITSWIPTDSNYHSLQVKVDRRFNKGLLLATSYTYGRAINYSDDNDTVLTPANIELSKGRAGFDRTHMFSQTFVWDLPLGKDGHWFKRAVLGGWQLSGILVAQTGTPINFTANGADLHAPGNTQRPN
ncbi:MAG: TonB-dependent receptor domain-containing protein, partial [Blastocatellia bacterium]